MEINSYSDYIVERLEPASIVTIFATGLVYVYFGFLAACVPSVCFHLWAYFGWRRFRQDAATTPQLDT